MMYNDGMQYINIGSKKAFTMQVALIFSCTNFDSNTQDAIFCIVSLFLPLFSQNHRRKATLAFDTPEVKQFREIFLNWVDQEKVYEAEATLQTWCWCHKAQIFSGFLVNL